MMKKGKETKEGIELRNQESIGTQCEKENNLGILEFDIIKKKKNEIYKSEESLF